METSADDFAKKAVLERLNMSEANLDEAVEKMHTWLLHQAHLPHTLDKNVLRSFIVGTSSIEVGKERLQNYFNARINYPNELSDRDPMKIAWDCIQPLAYLPDLTPEGYLILFLQLPNLAEVVKFDLLETLRYISMMTEVVLRERPYITGHITVVDLRYLSMKLVPKVSISYVSDFFYLVEHCFPHTLKAIYNFNTPKIADTLQRTLLKPVMSNGLYNMIISYTEDEQCLKRHMPIEVMPQDMGGRAPPIREIMRDWKVKLENAREMFLKECTELPDATKAPRASSNNNQYGSLGSFRKLDVD